MPALAKVDVKKNTSVRHVENVNINERDTICVIMLYLGVLVLIPVTTRKINMSERFILAGVGDIQLFDKSTGDIIVTSKTLTDSGINFTVTAEDIRGGLANGLLGKYFHDTAMELTLTDALFSLEYLALNVGGTITASSNVLTMEQVTTTVDDTITVVDTPQNFGGIGTIG